MPVSTLQCPSTSATGQSPAERHAWPLLLPALQVPEILQLLLVVHRVEGLLLQAPFWTHWLLLVQEVPDLLPLEELQVPGWIQPAFPVHEFPDMVPLLALHVPLVVQSLAVLHVLLWLLHEPGVVVEPH